MRVTKLWLFQALILSFALVGADGVYAQTGTQARAITVYQDPG
jgi:hypothetical protein